MKKSPVCCNEKVMGSPNYSQKGWSSERVSQAAMSSRRHTSLAGFTPFNSGRTLPSKWDEAERWISSPLSTYLHNTASSKASSSSSHPQPQRRPKSKSGPIVPPPSGIAYYSNYSPTLPLMDGLAIKNLMPPSPFSTGVLAPDAVSLHHYDVDNGVHCSCPSSAFTGIGVVPLPRPPRWSELLSECDPSSPCSQAQGQLRIHDESKNEDGVVSKRDKGTQMSPESEDEEESAVNTSPSAANTDEQSQRGSKLEVRDVEVDSEATIIRWSKRHASKMIKSNSLRAKQFSETSTEAEASSWDLVVADSTINISKVQREEAKISAWENLQKAKAEAAIRKLEMKLEKKRSSSMDKILNKLRWAEMKAEKMRGSVPAQQRHSSSKLFWFPKYAKIWPRRSCFTGHDL
ncbi:Remorin 4.1 [Senna tora]|uniref:Remorin 4.1 n=1 Tax=Senna tora TaxID=362788 RepID=A0A834WMS9_9FABA|nr:Remorin 4.1 [Senna tora]